METVHPGLVRLAAAALDVHMQTIEHSVDKAKVAEAVKGVHDIIAVLRDLSK